MKKLLIVIFVLLMTFAVTAQDPTENWCNPGGPMDGKCTIPGDEALTNYFWELGWYLAAVDSYKISLDDIPDRFKKVSSSSSSGDDGGHSSGRDADCGSVVLPGLPDSAVSVTGQLIYGGVTYASETIPAAVYNALAAGETYDPSIIGDRHRVTIKGVDIDGNRVFRQSYKFNCSGDFDPTGGGFIP